MTNETTLNTDGRPSIRICADRSGRAVDGQRSDGVPISALPHRHAERATSRCKRDRTN